MFDTDSDVSYDIEPTATEKPKASTADGAAEAAKKTAEAEKREKRRARQKRQAFTEQMQNLTMDDIRRLMESSVDLGGVSDPQAEIERRIERNGMAYLMKDGAVYAVVLSSDDYERLATRRRRPRIGEGRRARGRHRNTVAAFFMSRRNARNTDRTTMESERKRSRRTRTAPPRCTPAGAGRYRVGAHRDVGHAPARQTPAAIGRAGYSHPVITSSATRTCRHLSASSS